MKNLFLEVWRNFATDRSGLVDPAARAIFENACAADIRKQFAEFLEFPATGQDAFWVTREMMAFYHEGIKRQESHQNMVRYRVSRQYIKAATLMSLLWFFNGATIVTMLNVPLYTLFFIVLASLILLALIFGKNMFEPVPTKDAGEGAKAPPHLLDNYEYAMELMDDYVVRNRPEWHNPYRN